MGPQVDFDQYVADHGATLLRFGYVLTRDFHAAEDVVQTGLAEAFRRWDRIADLKHRDAYIRRIIVNSYLSAKRRRSSTEWPAGLMTGMDRAASDHADTVVLADEIRSILDGLPPRARAILVLRYYEDLDDAAIGAMLHISRNTVSSTASRALASLRPRNAAMIPGHREGPRRE